MNRLVVVIVCNVDGAKVKEYFDGNYTIKIKGDDLLVLDEQETVVAHFNNWDYWLKL